MQLDTYFYRNQTSVSRLICSADVLKSHMRTLFMWKKITKGWGGSEDVRTVIVKWFPRFSLQGRDYYRPWTSKIAYVFLPSSYLPYFSSLTFACVLENIGNKAEKETQVLEYLRRMIPPYHSVNSPHSPCCLNILYSDYLLIYILFPLFTINFAPWYQGPFIIMDIVIIRE